MTTDRHAVGQLPVFAQERTSKIRATGRRSIDGSTERCRINLTYAVDRLYQTGWTQFTYAATETLWDGRRFPSLLSMHRAAVYALAQLSEAQTQKQLAATA